MALLALADAGKDCNCGTWWMLTVGVGTAVGWAVALWHKWRDVERIKIESVNHESSILDKLGDAQSAYDAANAQAVAAGNAVLAEIRGDKEPSKLNDLREDFCTRVFGDAFGRYVRVMDMEYLDCRKTPEEVKRLIDDCLIPDLEDMQKRLAVMNHPELLRLVKRKPMTLKPRSFRRLRRIARGVPSNEWQSYYEKIDKRISALCA